MNKDSTQIDKDTTFNITSVADIKKVYDATINRMVQNLQDSVSIEYDCEHGTRGGTITYFTKSGNLNFIEHQYHEYDHHSAIDQYLIVDNTLYFVYSKRVSWSFVGQEVTEDKITEQRVYLVDNKPTNCLKNTYTIISNDPNRRLEESGNRKTSCPSVEPLLENFNKIVAFKDQPRGGCLGELNSR